MNSSAFGENEYDDSIRKTIPFYAQMQEQVTGLVNSAGKRAVRWLDTGCGTGNMAELAVSECHVADMTLADPSPEMLELAGRRAAAWHVPVCKICAGTQELSYSNEFDVITAFQAHHYLIGFLIRHMASVRLTDFFSALCEQCGTILPFFK